MVNQFTGHSSVETTINYNTLKITVIITRVKPHAKSSQADFQFFFNYELPVAMSYSQVTLNYLGSSRVLCYDRRSAGQSVLE
jgi:hypothetical protein